MKLQIDEVRQLVTVQLVKLGVEFCYIQLSVRSHFFR